VGGGPTSVSVRGAGRGAGGAVVSVLGATTDPGDVVAEILGTGRAGPMVVLEGETVCTEVVFG
jgi:hypothetical protein